MLMNKDELYKITIDGTPDLSTQSLIKANPNLSRA